MTINGHSPHAILRLRRLTQKIGISNASVYNKLNPKSKYHDPSFPKPIRLGVSSVGWLESSVDAWLDSCIAASQSTFP
jgi:prophage regulatory protein